MHMIIQAALWNYFQNNKMSYTGNPKLTVLDVKFPLSLLKPIISVTFWSTKNIQGAYKLSENFAKPYFHKYWTEIHDVTTISKRNVCSFIVTLNAFDVRLTCDTADVQTILPFPPNSPKHVETFSLPTDAHNVKKHRDTVNQMCNF